MSACTEARGARPRTARCTLRALIALILVPGCAIDVPTVSLRAEGDAESTGSAPDAHAHSALASEGELGVLPFRDLRPEIQRAGQETTLWPWLLYYRRVGDWITGDEAFDQDVSSAITQRVITAMSGSRFGRARPLPASGEAAADESAEASEPCGVGGVSYVASGSVLELYGLMRQRFELLLIPTPFIGFFLYRNDKSDAVGVAHVDVRVVECETQRTVYQRRLHAQRRAAETPISDAARIALDDLVEQLRNETILP